MCQYMSMQYCCTSVLKCLAFSSKIWQVYLKHDIAACMTSQSQASALCGSHAYSICTKPRVRTHEYKL